MIVWQEPLIDDEDRPVRVEGKTDDGTNIAISRYAEPHDAKVGVTLWHREWKLANGNTMSGGEFTTFAAAVVAMESRFSR